MDRRLTLFLLFTIVIVLLFWYSSVLQEQFYVVVKIFDAIVLENRSLAIGVFVLAAAVAALISPLTNIPLVPIAVAIWGPSFTTAILLCGWFIGDILAYVIGRYVGRKAVSYFVPEERLERWSSTVKEHTNIITAFFLRLALPAELGYAFGIVRYHAGWYILITVLAELPFAVVATYASEAVLSGDVIKFFWFTAILFLLIFFAFFKIRKK
ncbi:MAG: hypothetical protein A2845_04070 [Candidatus Lloydbacteria bacterium RIFCSPHIGHO2_01_FULL_49_22]|uniref:VTT domain-containing protein n=1 Tax=Candidatus Lloydbacteria bacterium RIFCSPHIGHO2_01_FULL_49_22 TaxID=1798658 RepID=A0A1G2CZ45_9BACT|nr:MAG: hypothetical protein A2845_04070 [Candidatus Lloydbacteria bacterium RIFCSPHIGHO2_01_FULL_49_22]OGZ09103.1 MAG: hypothetical protein A3C14_03905 [Candidatus Lloydbacteria bacterium RIFCSPHIGHO2_02_FULL_50_18]